MIFTRTHISTLLLAGVVVGRLSAADIQPDWVHSTEFPNEQSFTAKTDHSVRIHVNAPVDDSGRPAKATRLIVFALPNGNTLEQTLGCAGEGRIGLALRHSAHCSADPDAADARTGGADRTGLCRGARSQLANVPQERAGGEREDR